MRPDRACARRDGRNYFSHCGQRPYPWSNAIFSSAQNPITLTRPLKRDLEVADIQVFMQRCRLLMVLATLRK